MAAIKIDSDNAGLRIDLFLIKKLPDMSRSSLQARLLSGEITVNGKNVRKNYLLRINDEINISIGPPKPVDIAPEAIALDIIYEDNDLAVINKPKGMVVHPAAGHFDGTLVNALLFHFGDSLSGINGSLRPGIVHRIDKDTSGLILAAKNDTAHRALAAQIKNHTAARIYEAIVCGNIKTDNGTINAPIGRHNSERKRMAVTKYNSREAITHYEVLGRYPGYTHLRLRLETGRTHQIRVHMSHIGHPVLGDTIYGHRKHEFSTNGQCLHAGTIGFTHPKTGEVMEFTAPLPQYFENVLTKLSSRV